MALAARKVGPKVERPRPHLVATPSRSGSSRTSGARGLSEGECRAVFTAVALSFIILTAVGLARVALTADLARSAFSSTALQARIKTERQLGERLEANRSALLTPSRIEGIAADTMKMTQPRTVRYMRLGPARAQQPTPEKSVASAPVARASAGGMSGFVAAAVNLAADEAKTLLIGDVGLASSR